MKTTKTKKHVSRHLRQFARANEAVSALEYALLVGIAAVAIGAALVTFGGNVSTAISNIGNQIDAFSVDGITNPNAAGGGGGNAGNGGNAGSG